MKLWRITAIYLERLAIKLFEKYMNEETQEIFIDLEKFRSNG
jgi:hypothetical protein